MFSRWPRHAIEGGPLVVAAFARATRLRRPFKRRKQVGGLRRRARHGVFKGTPRFTRAMCWGHAGRWTALDALVPAHDPFKGRHQAVTFAARKHALAGAKIPQ